MKSKSIRVILALVIGCICSLASALADSVGGKYPSFDEAAKAARGKNNASFRFVRKGESEEKAFARDGMSRGAAAEFDDDLAKTRGLSKNDDYTGEVYATWDEPEKKVESGDRIATKTQTKTDSSEKSFSMFNGWNLDLGGAISALGNILGIGANNVGFIPQQPVYFAANQPIVSDICWVQDRQRGCRVQIRNFCSPRGGGGRGGNFGGNGGNARGGDVTIINEVSATATSNSVSRNNNRNTATNNTDVTASNSGNNGGNGSGGSGYGNGSGSGTGSGRPNYYRRPVGNNGGNGSGDNNHGGGHNGGGNHNPPPAGPIPRPTTPQGSPGGPTQRQWDRSNNGSGLVFRGGDQTPDPGGDRGVIGVMAARRNSGGQQLQPQGASSYRAPSGYSGGGGGVMATMAARGGQQSQPRQQTMSPSRGSGGGGVAATMAARRNGGGRR